MACAALVLVLGSLYVHSRLDQPRRDCCTALVRLDRALRLSDANVLPTLVVLPTSLQAHSPAERAEFTRKALQGEISAAGLAMLRKEGRFGPLLEIFPEEGARWAAQAGVRPEDCRAFRLQRNGLRAEVVLVAEPATPGQVSGTFRVLRCNNVSHLVAPKP